MDWVVDAPAVVLVALTLSAVLLLVEVALPTFGVAGLSAMALGAVAVVSADDRGDPWWPLVLVASAVCIWMIVLAAQRSAPGPQIVAAALFAVGSVGYGLLAEDAATVALAVVGSVALPFSFHPLLRSATRLRDLPPQLGMEALVGRSGTVARWSGRSGTVRVEGSLWNADGPADLTPGDEIVVRSCAGMTVVVALGAPVP